MIVKTAELFTLRTYTKDHEKFRLDSFLLLLYNSFLSERNMAKAYDKEFLVSVYMDRFIKTKSIPIETLCELEENANKLFDRVGKDSFRTYAEVTPETIRSYRG